MEKQLIYQRPQAPHAISYPITTHFGLPHGHAVAITLGDFFEINGNLDVEYNDPRGQLYVQKIMDELYQKFEVTNAKKCKFVWEEFVKKIGVNINKNENNLSEESTISKILDGVNTERLSNNPVKITNDDIVKILKYM